MQKNYMCLTRRALLTLILAAPLMIAQPAQPPSPDEVMQILGEKLQLTDDQKANIAPIIADRRQQLKNLQNDTSQRRFQKARKMKSIFEESDKKINALLTSTQKKEYAQLKQQLRQRMQEQRQNNSSQ